MPSTLVLPHAASTKPLSRPAVSSRFVISALCIAMWILCLATIVTSQPIDATLQTIAGP